MTATVRERRTMTREQWRPPRTAVAMGGSMPKDDGTRISSRSGGDGNSTAERLVGPPPGPLLANIIRGRRDAAQKCCHLAAMLMPPTTTVRMKMGGSE
jgi:hypothetical protein